jgi:DNA-binding MarR family transcriptional regulator
VPDQPILESLRITSLLAGRLLERELAARGVPADQFALVDEIGRAEPVTPSDLARRTGHPPTTLSDHLNRLSRRGLVRRERNPIDGRSRLISLTDAGSSLRAAGSPAVERAEELVAARLRTPVHDIDRALAHLEFAARSALDNPIS